MIKFAVATYGTLFLFVGICMFIVGSFTWPYIIGAWALYFGKAVFISWWKGGLIGLVPGLGPIGIPVAIITWICMMLLI
ncbi:MAG: hypothetical protein F9K32_00600 [Desulfobulbaceae bacterium]|nr:MAG: hypothetical protein F9K32_00600 [Desulfobulbaceae bacterium]